MFPLHPLFLGFLVALGIGLLIGIDRERKKGEGPTRHAAGLRTFTLAALLGAVAIVAGGELLLAAAALLYYIFQSAHENFEYGKAAAATLISVAVLLAISFGSLRIMERGARGHA